MYKQSIDIRFLTSVIQRQWRSHALCTDYVQVECKGRPTLSSLLDDEETEESRPVSDDEDDDWSDVQSPATISIGTHAKLTI